MDTWGVRAAVYDVLACQVRITPLGGFSAMCVGVWAGDPEHLKLCHHRHQARTGSIKYVKKCQKQLLNLIWWCTKEDIQAFISIKLIQHTAAASWRTIVWKLCLIVFFVDYEARDLRKNDWSTLLQKQEYNKRKRLSIGTVISFWCSSFNPEWVISLNCNYIKP